MRFHLVKLCVLILSAASAGCVVTPHHALHQRGHGPLPLPDMPQELAKTALPTYTIEPPDILTIEALSVIPRSPYKLRTGDTVVVNAPNALEDAPIAGPFTIQPGGLINLGPIYGAVKIAGLTPNAAETAVKEHLKDVLQNPTATLSLVEMSGKQQIAGQHLVGPDGTITLGSYGSISVVGLTLVEARIAIENHLETFLEDPEVAVDVFGYNSKVYYIITEGAGLGDGVTRFPITGNETVLDAIANINGLTQVSSKRIWIARPAPEHGGVQVLPVDWAGITALGTASTNYQLMPGDRVFVAEDKLVAFDTNLAKLLAPVERAMGFTLLGTGTVTRLSGKVLRGGGNPNNNGGGSF